ncbi:hypothetical protein JJB07_10055 [Tumebacillus sp. ITR2]|uniref:Uncharacterized protein n=1 Tax=Tumebacillus amylolyticus TaxID=2801339 RepID=A0ABS1JBK2_9BACL|nr:hypothetical protein [Tumebacillus amylolyticus]MBL0386998.1 hypothetical protein [Tumebacillus amylolyticus]
MNSWKKACAAWLAACCLSIVGAVPANAAHLPQSNAPERQALLVLVNRLSNDDIQEMPHLQEMARGLLNVNTGGGHTDGSAYATLAFGRPTKMQESAVLAFNASEALPKRASEVPASAMYRQLSGTPAREGDGVLLLSMFKQQRQQDVRQWAGTLGTFGDAMHSQGLRTAVYGSSDRGTSTWRPAALVTTDSLGETDLGDVSARLLTPDPMRPYGVRTDYQQMGNEFTRTRSQAPAALVVFDLADLYRLETYRSKLTEARYRALRTETLQEIDAFVGTLLSKTDANHLLLVASPEVSTDAAKQQEWLAPIAMAGGQTQADAVLTSATTRRVGLVTNLDVVPTIADFLHVSKPTGMIGYPLTTTSKLKPSALNTLKTSIIWTYTHRTVLLVFVGVLVGLGFLAALLRLLLVTGPSVSFSRRLLWIVMAMPLCLYTLPLWHARNFVETGAVLVASLLLFLAIPFRILSITQSVAGRSIWISGWTIGVVLFDIWQGGSLSKSSLLSYDPIVGARYYGVGNEYMGILVGAVALFYGALLHLQATAKKSRVPFVNLGFLLTGALLTAFFASPALGTNTGGALTMAGTTALCLSMQKRRRPLRAVVGLTLSLVGAVGLILWLNQSSAVPSHIGMATHQVLSGGFVEVLRIFSRKSEMFVRFFTTSMWSTVLLAAYGVFLWFLFRKPQDFPAAPALMGGALGAAVGLLTNDSGVAVTGMMLLFTLFPYLLLGLERMQQELDIALGHRES